MSVLDQKSLKVELSCSGKGKMRLQIPLLGLINERPVLAKEFLISSQLLLSHQDVGLVVFFFK